VSIGVGANSRLAYNYVTAAMNHDEAKSGGEYVTRAKYLNIVVTKDIVKNCQHRNRGFLGIRYLSLDTLVFPPISSYLLLLTSLINGNRIHF